MDTTKDYYAALGVLPSAENAVIRAVYRALAQRYHPDKVDGSREEATRRMAEINAAYEVLSNKEARNAYDLARGTRAKPGDEYFGERAADAPPGFDPLDQDWRIARKYYPDRQTLQARLRKFSWRVEYSFRAHVLEKRLFDQRKEVADAIEQQFLETYFGTDPRIIAFARELITFGHRAAAKELAEDQQHASRGDHHDRADLPEKRLRRREFFDRHEYRYHCHPQQIHHPERKEQQHQHPAATDAIGAVPRAQEQRGERSGLPVTDQKCGRRLAVFEASVLEWGELIEPGRDKESSAE